MEENNDFKIELPKINEEVVEPVVESPVVENPAEPVAPVVETPAEPVAPTTVKSEVICPGVSFVLSKIICPSMHIKPANKKAFKYIIITPRF